MEERLCDACGRDFPEEDFDCCGCGYEACIECFDDHAMYCFEDEDGAS